MGRLLLVAAMLMLPAVTVSGTVIGYDDIVLDTDFDDYAYGTIKGVMDSGPGMVLWGSRQPEEMTVVIDDPTSDGRGKVVAFVPDAVYVSGTETGKVRLYGNRQDVPHPVTHPYGLTVLEFDLFLVSNGGAFPNAGLMEWRPGQTLYLDPTGEQWQPEIDLWASGPAFDPFGWDLVTTPVSPLPLDEWFTIRQVLDNVSGTYDFYVNGELKMSGAPTYLLEDQQVVWEYYVLDLFAFPGDPYMLLDKVTWHYTVPEPSVLALAGLGLLVLVRWKRK